MAENDIYNSQRKYENLKQSIISGEFALQPEKRPKHDKLSYKRVYYCKNPENLKYFERLFPIFDAKDLSYIRRCRILQNLKLVVYATEEDLSNCDRKSIDLIVAFMHKKYNSTKTKQDFIRDTKYLWKLLFPEKDEKGRYDETIMPYVVRHLSDRMDKSKEKLRNDRFTWEEFEQILNYFSLNPKMQAYLFLALESLGRPQEILYTKIRDIEIYDNYAKIWISEHGKEGTGFLQCIDSFPYVAKWYNQHPLKNDKNAFFFMNTNCKKCKYEQMSPVFINKMLKIACRKLNIHKSITPYSFLLLLLLELPNGSLIYSE